MDKIKIKPLVVSLLVSLGVGAVAGFLTSGSVDVYNTLNLPALSPPSVVFPIVWTALYILMGVSAYIIYSSGAKEKNFALRVYGVQLLQNYIWPLVFFNMNGYVLAFIILILLWLTVIYMIYRFYRISRLAAILQIPYIIWLTFAAYLNLAVIIYNT